MPFTNCLSCLPPFTFKYGPPQYFAQCLLCFVESWAAGLCWLWQMRGSPGWGSPGRCWRGRREPDWGWACMTRWHLHIFTPSSNADSFIRSKVIEDPPETTILDLIKVAKVCYFSHCIISWKWSQNFQRNGIDGVVGIGGGSSMDAAKVQGS